MLTIRASQIMNMHIWIINFIDEKYQIYYSAISVCYTSIGVMTKWLLHEQIIDGEDYSNKLV